MADPTAAETRVLSAVDGPWATDRLALVFCGHTDVVPAGDRSSWPADPFVPRVRDRGVSAVELFAAGPGDLPLAHGPSERVPLAEVVTAARACALLTLRRCGVA